MARTSDTSLATYIDDYRVAIEAKLSPRTVVGYQKALRELDALLGHPSLAGFSVEAVERIITAKRTTSPSNARLIAAVAKTFSRWLYRKRLTQTHILDTLGVPAFNGRRRAFTDPEFHAIRRVLDTLPARARAKTRAVVLLAMGSGLRSNEMRELDIADVTIAKPLADSFIRVRWDTSKSQTERLVRLDPESASALHAYIAERPDRDGQLFISEEGRPYSYFGWGQYISRISDALELQGVKGWNAHRCRHQWATMNAREGATDAQMRQEGGWTRGSKVPSRYIDEIPFADIQRKPTAMSAFIRRAS